MKMALDGDDGLNVVRSYAPGCIRVGNTEYTRSLVVLPQDIIADWPPTAIEDLRPTHLGALIDFAPEVVVLGSGETQAFPDPRQLVTLIDLGIGYEVMNNAAACRTFNILLGEGRRAALALILP